MTMQDPKQFIEAYLSLPSGAREPSPPPPVDSWLGGPFDIAWRVHGMNAKAGTIHFIKQRDLFRRQVHVVSFEDQARLTWDYICIIGQDEQGFWHSMGGGGTVVKQDARKPTRSFPWVHLYGGFNDSHLWAGGSVTEQALDAHRVRLTTKNGLVLEDTVQDGFVLFLTDQSVEVPVKVEVFRRSGELIGTQTAFDYAVASK